MTNGLRVHRGGSGGPVLLLLHGLGATSDVWSRWHPLLAERWPGAWLAPDLPGHGGSKPLPKYSFESLADAVAGLVKGSDRIIILGHSLGGVIGLVLAGPGFDLPVQAVVGLGIKVSWMPEELDKARALAERPVTWFASRDEAASRYLRVSGLAGLVPEDDPTVTPGLSEADGRWRLAMDPAAFAVGAPDMPALVAGCGASVLLARGEHDPMNTDDDMARLGVPTMTLAGLGHNAHVEDPESVYRCLP